MITSLQNFISTKGKFVFVLLLFLVVVSFVLYLSQGSSVFDLFPDPNRERKEFFGYDWNDPEQRRSLRVASRVAADFGAVVSPGGEALSGAEESYVQALQARMQNAFKANPEEVDQQALQSLFSYMQAWPNFPDDAKAREIARSGTYDQKFMQAVIEAKVALDGQADNWGFLPLNLNHPAINARFSEYLANLGPGMEDELNRTRSLGFVGQRHGLSGQGVESVLYDSFRTRQVEGIYRSRGYALPEEVRVDLRAVEFAWDGEVAELRADDLTFDQPTWISFEILSLPKKGDSITLNYGSKNRRFVFVDNPADANGSDRFVRIGTKPVQALSNLKESIDAEDFGLVSRSSEKNILGLAPLANRLPRKFPVVRSNSDAIKLNQLLKEDFSKYHEDRKNEAPFAEEPRTFASALIFSTQSFLVEPPAPDEARLRSYFDRNQLDFLKAPEASPTEDENGSEAEPVTMSFEEARDEVLRKITEQDKADALRDAELLARDAALELLDSLNGLGEGTKAKYPNYQELRKSTEFSSLIERSGARAQKIAFSQKEMSSQAMVLGLERRESERQNNREPLEEVRSLNDRMFFTRSIRKSRDGFVVFVLDMKTERMPGSFEKASFADLYKGLTAERASNFFSEKADQSLAALMDASDKSEMAGKVRRFGVKARSARLARAGYDAKSRVLRSRVEKLEKERNDLSSADANASGNQQSMDALDKRLVSLRKQIEVLGEERGAISRLLEKAPSMEVDGVWKELERSEDRAVFARLTGVYSLRSEESSVDDLAQRKNQIEAVRGQEVRDSLLRDLIESRLGEIR